MHLAFNVYPKILNGFDGIYTSANRLQDGYAWSQPAGVTFDSDGWPDQMPPGVTINREFARINSDMGEPYTGDFVFTAKGSAEVMFRMKEKVSPAAWPATTLQPWKMYRPGDSWTITVPRSMVPSLLEIRIRNTDPDSTGDHLTAGRLVHHSMTGAQFNPAFKALHKQGGYVRWMEASWRKEALPQWEGAYDARTMDHYCWGGDGRANGDRLYGVPDVAAMELAKETGTVPMINIPANASDEWVSGLFEMIASYKPHVPIVRLACGNENWLTKWEGTKHCIAMAKQDWPNHWQNYRYKDKVGFSWAMKRTMQMAEIGWQIDDPASPQFEWVWETQGSQWDATAIAMEKSLWHEAEPNHRLLPLITSTIKRVDANAYFGAQKHIQKHLVGSVTDPNALYAACIKSIDSRIQTMRGNKQTADKYGMAFGVYEGGDSLIGHQYAYFRDTPQMAALYEYLFSECEKLGVDVFFHFADCFPRGGQYDWGAVSDWTRPLASTAKGAVIQGWIDGDVTPAPVPVPIPPPVVPPTPEPIPLPPPVPVPQPPVQSEAEAIADELDALAVRLRAL